MGGPGDGTRFVPPIRKGRYSSGPWVRGKVTFGSPEAKGLGSRERPWSWLTCSPRVPPAHPELFVTEASHVRTLRVLDLVFYQRMRKESLLSREELARLFPNLPELMEAHSEPRPTAPPRPCLPAPPALARSPSRSVPQGPAVQLSHRPLCPPTRLLV